MEVVNDFRKKVLSNINKVLDDLARTINKNSNSYENSKQRKSATTLELMKFTFLFQH